VITFFKTVVGKPGREKKALARTRCERENTVKIENNGIGCDISELAQMVNTVIKFRVP
jgi:hypothetical protein